MSHVPTILIKQNPNENKAHKASAEHIWHQVISSKNGYTFIIVLRLVS